MPAIIRLIQLEDAAALRELRLEALRLNPTAFGADYQAAVDLQMEEWVSRCSSKEGSALFVAQMDGALVGMAGVMRDTSPKRIQNARIWGVYVAEKHRGAGLGEKLITQCQRWAADAGVQIIKLSVVADNAGAIKCYERCGFVRYGREPKALMVNGVCYDELMMAWEPA